MTSTNLAAASRTLELSRLPGSTDATCKQCGKRARFRVTTDVFTGYLCSVHMLLALHHYTETHRLG